MIVGTGETSATRNAGETSRARADRLGERADRCFRCDVDLDDRAVWRVRVYLGYGPLGTLLGPSVRMVPLCDECGEQELRAKASRRGYDGPRPRPVPCEFCSRPVVNPYPGVRRQHVFCSRGCEREWRSALARERRAERRGSRRCETCGDELEPARADARHCSSACRQRAYRARARSARPLR